MLKNSWVGAQLAASQDGLSSMELYTSAKAANVMEKNIRRVSECNSVS
jgi:hypothetical protein